MSTSIPESGHPAPATTSGCAKLESSAPAEDREAKLARLLHLWWLSERPRWTDVDWWDAPLRDDVRRLLWLPPGPRLAEALESLPQGWPCALDHAGESPPGRPEPGHAEGWPCACMVVVAAAWEACAAWTAAGAARSVVAAAGRHPVTFRLSEGLASVTDPAREELARALRVTPASMGNRIAAARGLIEHPALLDLVADASISAWAARLVVMEVADLDVEQAREVVEQVSKGVTRRLEDGRRAWTSAEVGRAARLARLRICPDSDAEARARAFAQRRVQVMPGDHGMATLIADLADTDAHRIHRRLSAIARGLADSEDPRTRDQVRADVLVDLLLGPGLPFAGGVGAGSHSHSSDGPCRAVAGATDPAELDPTGSGTAGPAGCSSTTRADASTPRTDASDRTTAATCTGPVSPPEIRVIVSLETLLGIADEPALVPGMGPIPADVARALGAEGRWQAWVADARGAVTATGSRGYVPSEGLARLIRAREPHCRMPGCRQAAERCDLDHAIPYPRGATEASNLGPLCRRHHVMKTHAGWTLEPSRSEDDPGRVQGWKWRTPAGFTITDEVEPLVTTGRSRGPGAPRGIESPARGFSPYGTAVPPR